MFGARPYAPGSYTANLQGARRGAGLDASAATTAMNQKGGGQGYTVGSLNERVSQAAASGRARGTAQRQARRKPRAQFKGQGQGRAIRRRMGGLGGTGSMGGMGRLG